MGDTEKWQAATGYATPDEVNAALLDNAAEIKRLRERESRFAALMGVPDGGRYQNDWEARAAAIDKSLRATLSATATLEQVNQKQAEIITACGEALEAVRDSRVPLPTVAALYVDAALRLAGRRP